MPSWKGGGAASPLLVPSYSRMQEWPVPTNLAAAACCFSQPSGCKWGLSTAETPMDCLGVCVTWRSFSRSLGGSRFSSLPSTALHACFPRRDFWHWKSINYFVLLSLSILLVTAHSSDWKFRNTGNKVEKLVECGRFSFFKMHDWQETEATCR